MWQRTSLYVIKKRIAMTGNAFHMEVLAKSINELQQEKLRGEQRLREVRIKRKALEKKFENAYAKYSQLEEKHSKMAEMCRVAEHKVTQSQAELDSQLSVSKQLQAQVQQLEDTEKDRKEQYHKDMEDVEEQLSQMTVKFHRSRQFYTDESLLNEIDLMKQKAQELDEEVGTIKIRVDETKSDLAELKMAVDKTKSAADEQGIPVALQREVLAMFTEENESSNTWRQNLQDQTKAADAELSELKDWKPPQDITLEE